MSTVHQFVVVDLNKDKPAAREALPKLTAWFRRKGIGVVSPQHASKAKWGVVLGGDGSILRAARQLAPFGIPVLGVNLGQLGFNAGTDVKRMFSAFNDMLADRLAVSSRMMLTVEPPGQERQLALNDCVIKAQGVRVSRLSAKIDGMSLGTFIGDGLIVATPTGSTAYSLAASGPIVRPDMDLLLLTPISPHSLNQRPVVLPPWSTLEIEVDKDRHRSAVFLSIDGQVNFSLRPGDSVVVRRAPDRAKIFYDRRQSYFSLLREKLKWGER